MYYLPNSEVDNNHRDLHFLVPVLPGNFLGPESCFVFVVFAFKIKALRPFNNFENNTVTLSVNEAKLTDWFLGKELCFYLNRFWF